MMKSCAIDGKEGRYVIMTDIPGALLHSDMRDTVQNVVCIIKERTVWEVTSSISILEIIIRNTY